MMNPIVQICIVPYQSSTQPKQWFAPIAEWQTRAPQRGCGLRSGCDYSQLERTTQVCFCTAVLSGSSGKMARLKNVNPKLVTLAVVSADSCGMLS